MKSIVSTDINNLYQWMDLIVNKKEVILDDIDASINLYGNDDSIYLLINIYQNDSKSTEYLFKPSTNINALSALVFLLESVDYSLNSLINKIETAEYISGDLGNILTLGKINIYKELVISN